MQKESLEDKVNYLMDRAEITDVMGRYCLGFDLRDWDLYKSCWVDEVTFDFSGVGIGDAPCSKIKLDDWVRAMQACFAGFDQTQHIKYPVSFEFEGDRANVYAMLQGKHRVVNSSGDPLQTVVGYYRDVYVRTDKGWKMSSSTELVLWNEGNFEVIRGSTEKVLEVLRAVTDLPAS